MTEGKDQESKSAVPTSVVDLVELIKQTVEDAVRETLRQLTLPEHHRHLIPTIVSDILEDEWGGEIFVVPGDPTYPARFGIECGCGNNTFEAVRLHLDGRPLVIECVCACGNVTSEVIKYEEDEDGDSAEGSEEKAS